MPPADRHRRKIKTQRQIFEENEKYNGFSLKLKQQIRFLTMASDSAWNCIASEVEMATSKVISMAKFVPNTNSFDTKKWRLKMEAWTKIWRDKSVATTPAALPPGGLAFHTAKTVKFSCLKLHCLRGWNSSVKSDLNGKKPEKVCQTQTLLIRKTGDLNQGSCTTIKRVEAKT